MEHLDQGLWITSRPLKVGAMDLGTRMTVIRLSDDRLWVCSPVELDDDIAAQVRSKGDVAAIVSPNRYHHLFVGAWAEAWPDAERWAAPGLPQKRPSLSFTGVLGDEAPPAWRGDIEQKVVEGVPMLGEVVFLHRSTGTLVLTDLAFNITEGGAIAKAIWKMNGCWHRFGPSRLLRLLVRDRDAYRRSIEHILSWSFDRVVITHGQVVERGGKDAFARAFS